MSPVPIDNNDQHQYVFEVEGMTCAACVTNVESAITSIRGVSEVSVNLATESATIFSNEPIPINTFTRAVKKMGYKLEPKGSSSLIHRQQRAMGAWKKLLLIQAGFGVPLLVYAMVEMFSDLTLLGQGPGIFFQISLASILVVSGSGYYKRGFKHLILRMPNMDTLVALGTGSAYVYSIISAANILLDLQINGFETLYFEAAGTILLFITFGKWLEAVAKSKTTEALTGLMDQMPTEAEVFLNGDWEITPLDQVLLGARIRVKPHTKIPVDGTVFSGSSSVDESSISGESLPVEKQVDSNVIGSSLNLQGLLEIRADRIGRESMFGQIITLVEEAQAKKPEIQKLVDRIASVFVPTVLTIAVLSALTWLLLGYDLAFAFNVMISVMIIACPCALGLATPTALVVGSGIAARGGILVKSVDAFQQLSRIDVMVFDKTGTLTKSEPTIVSTFPQSQTDYLSLAIGLDQYSQHPLAKPVKEYGALHGIEPSSLTDIEEEAGIGMRGNLGDALIRLRRIGQADVLKTDYNEAIKTYLKNGYTVSGVFSDEKIQGLIAFSDIIKPEGKAVVNALSNYGIGTVLLTGDKADTARQVGRSVGIDTIFAEVLPGDKHDQIKHLQTEGKTIGMLGDGINDAPALVAANVGLSFRGGTDIAINAADIVLLNDSLNNLIFAYRISKATISKIHQNLFWAFIYNLAGIPIAMGLLYPFTGTLLNPMFAGMAMAFSSVSVVANTLLLRSKDFYREI